MKRLWLLVCLAAGASLTAPAAWGQALKKPAVDLNGVWVDGDRLIRITHKGASVHAVYLLPKLCDHRDGTGQKSEYKYSFKGTLTGNRIEGTTCVCKYGEENKRGVGIEEARIRLTVKDSKTLSGEYHNTLRDAWVPISITRADCRDEIEKARAEAATWKKIYEEQRVVVDDMHHGADEARQAAIDEFKKQVGSDLFEKLPLPVRVTFNPADDAAGWVKIWADALGEYAKEMGKRAVAGAVKKAAFLAFIGEWALTLTNMYTKVGEAERFSDEASKSGDRAFESFRKWIDALIVYHALKEACAEKPAEEPMQPRREEPTVADSMKSEKVMGEYLQSLQTANTHATQMKGELQKARQSLARAEKIVRDAQASTPSRETFTDAEFKAFAREAIQAAEDYRAALQSLLRFDAEWRKARQLRSRSGNVG
jgi:hypothetical protein